MSVNFDFIGFFNRRSVLSAGINIIILAIFWVLRLSEKSLTMI